MPLTEIIAVVVTIIVVKALLMQSALICVPSNVVR
ncbi:hypothetical protein AWB72_01570 [Caballeronia concitans]|uniref:Uncharacterized protein n=1 Tax=Caballeronia concitans TaxID=1777133 RepID=A0A658QU70_9BURK|nr:hypothetical protein BurMR1_0049 [Burkholderia sp. MR1]SAL22302.1 hypothetical protein AWB72_01570 [Caballeronia concitans]